MKKYHRYYGGGNREQYKWSSQNANTDTSVHKNVATRTTNLSHEKLTNQHQYYSAAPTNGLTSRYHKPTNHFHNHTKFQSGSRPNKYVYINNSNDKAAQTKPSVSKLPMQHKSNDVQCKSTKNFTSSRNDVFRFTAVPNPVNASVNVGNSVVTKSNTKMPESCKKPETTTATTTTGVHHKLNKKRNNTIIPSRSQLKWTSKDNVNSTTQTTVVNSKPQTPVLPQALKRPHATKQPSSRSRFTWRRSSSGSTPRRHSSSNLTNHFVNRRHKMQQMKSSPAIQKKFNHRRKSSITSGRKIVYIGGIAYNATARWLSRRLSSGSSKKKALLKNTVKKTGNKVWVAEHHAGEPVEENHVHPGYEIRRKKGNWQWIPGNKSALVRQANAIKHKYAACKSQLALHPGKHRTKFLQVFIKNDVFVMDPSRRRLRRLSRTSLGGDSRRKSNSSMPNRTSAHQLANHAVRRSKALLVWHAAKKKKSVPKKSEQYCMFFNRFGKCSRKDTCPYIHDPDKIAVCRRFLRGTCDKTDGSCPFSHQIQKEKMPVCSYFLRGVCTKDDCPYLHVYVGENAEICQDFVKGFCPNGDKCDKKHLLDCPDFSVSGKCSRGDKCPLRHKKRSHKRRSSSTQTGSKEPKAFKRRRIVNQSSTNNRKTSSDYNNSDILITPDQLEFIPLEQGPSTPPDFIAL